MGHRPAGKWSLTIVYRETTTKLTEWVRSLLRARSFWISTCSSSCLARLEFASSIFEAIHRSRNILAGNWNRFELLRESEWRRGSLIWKMMAVECWWITKLSSGCMASVNFIDSVDIRSLLSFKPGYGQGSISTIEFQVIVVWLGFE